MKIAAASACLMVGTAVTAGGGLEVLPVLEVQEGLHISINFEDRVSALTAVAAVRAAVHVISVAIHAVTAVSAVAGLDINFGLIYEHS